MLLKINTEYTDLKSVQSQHRIVRKHQHPMRKRKYCNIASKQNTANVVVGNTLMQYQDMSEDECLARLLHRLNHKNVCQKFRSDKDNTTPTTHNMVSTIHIQTNDDKIDLDMISGCIPNSAYNKKRFVCSFAHRHPHMWGFMTRFAFRT